VLKQLQILIGLSLLGTLAILSSGCGSDGKVELQENKTELRETMTQRIDEIDQAIIEITDRDTVGMEFPEGGGQMLDSLKKLDEKLKDRMAALDTLTADAWNQYVVRTNDLMKIINDAISKAGEEVNEQIEEGGY